MFIAPTIKTTLYKCTCSSNDQVPMRGRERESEKVGKLGR